MDRGRLQGSTCTCSAIHQPAGDGGCSGEVRITSTTQSALFVCVKVAVTHKKPFCFETLNLDALHLALFHSSPIILRT